MSFCRGSLSCAATAVDAGFQRQMKVMIGSSRAPTIYRRKAESKKDAELECGKRKDP
jgi:hypothetical protein